MKKKIRILSILLIVILSISGCILNLGKKIYDNEKILVKDYDSFNLVQSKQHIEDGTLCGSADIMEGMGTIWKFTATDNTDVSISYHIEVSSGKAKLVLISPDDTVTTLTEVTPDSVAEGKTKDTFQVGKGKNRIKLVGGKNTKVNYEISIDKGAISSF